MKIAGPLPLPLVTTNPAPEFITVPVGAEIPVVLLADAGTVTTSDCGVPSAAYKVDNPVPLSDTQKTPPSAIPQALTRFGSVNFARPGTSETRSVRVYESLAPAP